MSIWSRLGEIVGTITVDAFSTVVEAVRTVFAGDPETRRQVSFSIAMIALSAKMAKADGIVTADEVEAFQEIFQIPGKEAENVSRLYNLAKQDVNGFHGYAQQVKKLFPDDRDILEDVLDGLFHIAKADGFVHRNEMAFLEEVAFIFGFGEREVECIKARHLDQGEGDPYLILEADRAWNNESLKRQHRKMVREHHPDKMLARGVPKEFLSIANDQLARINSAWDLIKQERGI